MSLTEQGFERPRLNEIKADYDQRFIEALGPVNTAPDAVVGQIIAIFSAALDDAYEALHAIYDSMYPSSAEAVSLDGAVSYVGLTRLGATATTVTAVCYGAESTLLPAGSLARAIDGKQYVATADTVISRASCADVLIEIATVTNSAAYQIIANGVSVIYTSDSSATASEIANGLASLFDTDNFVATVESDKLRLKPVDAVSGFTLTVDSKLAVALLGTPVVFTAALMGAYALPSNSLTRIDSSIDGWDSVNNPVEGAIGRFTETDEQLRARHANSIRVTGSATAQAIRSRILAEVDSVTYCSVYENRTNAIDTAGLPPHSFETIVSGGFDQEVGEKLFLIKPAAIETHGNTSISVIDENGDTQVCKFTRPTNKIAWLKITVNSLNTEEPLTSEIVATIKAAVIEYSELLGIGDDIITQRFYGPIYEATSGLGSITVEAAITNTTSDTPTYSTANISLTRAQLALFDITRVTVVGV
jgi:uncharacterized phage protein gp47/JayE